MKAWSTTTMTSTEKRGVHRMINETIGRLQRASVNRNHMGSRYSRLLHLLWRKVPSKHDETSNGQIRDDIGRTKPVGNSPAPPAFETSLLANHGAFSWLDLDAVGYFATRNNSVSASLDGNLEESMGEIGIASDMALFTDYRWLSDDNPNMIF
jgi:hypothetical protein